MRYLFFVLIFLNSGSAIAASAGQLLSQETQDAKCTTPDNKLIKQYSNGATQWISERTPSKKYNEQVKGFNDCARVYVEKANVEILRIRTNTKAQLKQMADDATARIRRIEGQIADAIERVKSIEGLASVASSGADTALDAFPAPECKLPDEALLVPLARQRDNTSREHQYDSQEKSYEGCMRNWIADAKAEIVRIKNNTEANMKPVNADANRQILEIWGTILEMAKQANLAQQQQDAVLADFKSSIAQPVSPPLPPEDVATDSQILHSADMPTGAGDPNAISCRNPQQLPGSLLRGPEVCKRNHVWAELYKRGQTISADGLSIVDSEKASTLGPNPIAR